MAVGVRPDRSGFPCCNSPCSWVQLEDERSANKLGIVSWHCLAENYLSILLIFIVFFCTIKRS